jgi:hypothetical protein
MKNKKGSHVGMILSFTLFIVFLIFVYTIVDSPLKTRKENENIFQDIQKKILEDVSAEVYTTFTYINFGLLENDCFEIINPKNLSDEMTSIVIMQQNNILNDETIYPEIGSEIEPGITKITDSGETISSFAKIYYSENLFEKSEAYSGTNCVKLTPEIILKETRIVEKNILSLIDKMANNYSLVKEEFGIGGEVDFHLEFEYENGTKISNSKFNEDLKREVFARSFYIDYLSIGAREKMGRFIIRVW